VVVIVNEVPEKPLITADGPLVLITGESVTLSATLSDSYLWSPGGEISQNILVTASGGYSVVVGNSFACESEASDIVTVTVSDFLPAPDITIAGSLRFCEGGEVNMTGPDGFTVYTWSNGETEQQITVTESGIYHLIVTDGAGHTSLPSDDIVVQVDELPELSLVSISEPLCFGDDNGGARIISTGGTPPYEYSWSDAGGSDEFLSSVAAGTYTVTVHDQNSCSDDLDLTIDQPESIFVDARITPAYCPDFIDGEVDLNVDGGIFPYSVVWGDGGTDFYYDDLGTGTYAYTVYDANNCEHTGTAEITYTNEVCFEIPEVITPNGDTYNDYWLIEGLEVYPDVIIQVYDRWGKRIFYSEGHDVYFDGTFNGKELPMESYHYIIDLNNGADRIIGNITILR
jgi:large repetitive protein